jgi:hypothetical protein
MLCRKENPLFYYCPKQIQKLKPSILFLAARNRGASYETKQSPAIGFLVS